MAAKKSETGAAKKTGKSKAKLMPTGPLASVLKKAKEPVVQRYLELLQLSTEGDLAERVERLYGFLEKRFDTAEPSLEPYIQICDCEAMGHALFDMCPFCGDVDSDAAGVAFRKKGGGEAAAAKMIHARWPVGFERVAPPTAKPTVQTTAAEVKTKKRSRSEAAKAAAAPAPLEPPVKEEPIAPPTAAELSREFLTFLRKDVKGDDNVSIFWLMEKAQENWHATITELLAWQAMALLEERGEAERRLDMDDEIQFALATPTGALLGKLTAAFGRALDAVAPNAISASAIVDAAANDERVDVKIDHTLDSDLIRKALLQLVQSGRATRRGTMLASTATPKELPGEEPQAEEGRPAREEPTFEPEVSENNGDEESDGPGCKTGLTDGEEAGEVSSILAPASGGARALVLEQVAGAGTVVELDAAVVEIHRLHAEVTLSVYEMGRILHRIIEGKLFLQRRDGQGHPVYETFTQFAKAELKITREYAYRLAQVASTYTRVQIEKGGTKKLIVLLAVDDPKLRGQLLDAAVEEKQTVGQLRLEIEKAQPGTYKPPSAPPSAPASAPEEEEADESAPESEKPRAAPAPRAQPAPSKGPTATPTPREQRITVALVPGRTVIDLFARVTRKGADPKRAKKIEQDPWARVELGNGVVQEFRVYVGPGGMLQLAVETTRSSS